jgi:membrane-bound metal-dependent hydrolase YbcI (DUF457 family)
MPYTPYHFGPSGFVGLLFRKRLDLPVFMLANVVVDIEVLIINWFDLGRPIHRYAHTLLLGAVVGVIWAAAAYPLRNVFKKMMQLIRLPYETSFLKMVVSGILGVWLHVLFDSVYHYDIRMFWPSRARPLWRLLTHSQIEMLCLISFAGAVIVYLLLAMAYNKSKKLPSENSADKKEQAK